MGSLEILQPGLLTTVQDRGRYGFQDSGFSVSGCMDAQALSQANILVNNTKEKAVLEMTFMGGTFLFHGHTYFALTGADMNPRLSGKEIQNQKAYEAKEGDILELAGAKTGRYGYLAVAGGILVDPVMGSFSTNLKCKLGGFEGRALKKGDLLPIQGDVKELWNMYLKEMPKKTYDQEILLRVVLGPQKEYFTEKGLETFQKEAYALSEKSDRMGYRLEGEAIEYKDTVDILSDGIVYGSIQVTPAGQPMVMMADRQTTGGYAKIGTVITPDLHLLAQCMPQAKVRFQAVSLEEASRLYKQQEKENKKFQRKSGYHIPWSKKER